MKRLITLMALILCWVWGMTPADAVNINLLNVNMGSLQTSPLTDMYSQAYGYTPQQVAPAMMADPQEVPGILQIAQAAGQVPMTVYMMRKMGMGFPSILSTFALAPSVLGGGAGPLLGSSPYGPGLISQYPTWNRVMHPYLIETSRITFLRDVLRVNPQFIPFIPYRGEAFSRALLRPYHPVHGTWMPPGIAKKYGLWMPPGQAKKVGWIGGPEHSQGGKHSWKPGKKGNHGPHANHNKFDKKNGPGNNLKGQKVYFGKGEGKNFKRGPVQAKGNGGSKKK